MRSSSIMRSRASRNPMHIDAMVNTDNSQAVAFWAASALQSTARIGGGRS
jgi:hypothetical protein